MGQSVFRVRPLVADTLRESSAARDDNNALILQVWRRCGLQVVGDVESIAATLPQAETIRRARARIQNEEERYPPSPSVQARRRKYSGPRKSTG
jgi:hypothetical protein